MIAIVAPGQGAQTPGFLTSWLADEYFAARLEWLSVASGIDFTHYGTGADAETIRDTAIAQPLLVAAGLCAWDSLAIDSSTPIITAGHSVGEFVAAVIAGVLSVEQAIIFVRERGQQMATAAATTPTSMTAVLGGDSEEVLSAIAAHGLTAANHNGTGQIVAGGTLKQLADFANDPPARARLRQLSVAGAFHTVHMQPAVAYLTNLAQAIAVRDPKLPILTNADGNVVTNGKAYLSKMVNQVASGVRWDLCMETFAKLGVTGLLELPPAGTLTAIAKRNLKGVEVLALNSADQLETAREFIARHSAATSIADLNAATSSPLPVNAANESREVSA